MNPSSPIYKYETQTKFKLFPYIQNRPNQKSQPIKTTNLKAQMKDQSYKLQEKNPIRPPNQHPIIPAQIENPMKRSYPIQKENSKIYTDSQETFTSPQINLSDSRRHNILPPKNIWSIKNLRNAIQIISKKQRNWLHNQRNKCLTWQSSAICQFQKQLE